METIMIKIFFSLFLVYLLFPAALGLSAEAPNSSATQECLDCHALLHPGIVNGWKKSRHARTTPAQALSVTEPARKVSTESIPKPLKESTVGCAECHTLRSEKHKDTVEHQGHQMHVVVTPEDCAVCHREEAVQYAGNIMSHAYANLADNSVYHALQESIIGKPFHEKGRIHFKASKAETQAETCYYCHGTKLEVTGFKTRDTDMGEVSLPVIKGWPNQGVGRVNPDGSLGACTPCHTRHTFSIEMARKPYTCKECHVGPDVPAFKVYDTSKHGNIFSALNNDWDFAAVPWTVGRDFTAPTCATCHISLLMNTEGETLAKRTHQMNDRLSWRIFGLIYAHSYPAKPDTTIIRNKDGQSLPTAFDGSPAEKYLIDADQRQKRTAAMQSVCRGCHSTSWVDHHWRRYEHTIAESNAAVGIATQVMADIWQHGFAHGPDRGGNPFDEGIERKWTDTWLFYTNTIRFAAAMAGGGDLGVFAEGRYQLTQHILELGDWLEFRKNISLGLPTGSIPIPKK